MAADAPPNHAQWPVIYIVDDDEAVRAALTFLAETRGWEARAFHSAREYLDARRQFCSRPACLVLDLQMPDMNGAELQEWLEAEQCAIPTIVVTAWPDGELASRARAAGARMVIAKPFAPAELAEVIEDALKAAR